MAFSRAILWVSSSQTGWRVFPKNRSSPILWLLSLLFTGSEKLRCFSEDSWSISFFSDSLWTSTVSLRHIAIHKTISYYCWIATSAINLYNWCARPFKIDIWWVDTKMINTIISDTFDKCLYWSFSVGGYVAGTQGIFGPEGPGLGTKLVPVSTRLSTWRRLAFISEVQVLPWLYTRSRRSLYLSLLS